MTDLVTEYLTRDRQSNTRAPKFVNGLLLPNQGNKIYLALKGRCERTDFNGEGILTGYGSERPIRENLPDLIDHLAREKRELRAIITDEKLSPEDLELIERIEFHGEGSLGGHGLRVFAYKPVAVAVELDRRELKISHGRYTNLV